VIPVFEGLLLGEHNEIIVDLLFELATWHMLASLRLYTESTIRALEDSTGQLGQILWQFQATMCTAYDTYELPSEEAARGCQTAAIGAKKHQDGPSKSVDNPAKAKKRHVQKVFNLLTVTLQAGRKIV